MSALGQERTSPVTKPMSASPPKADIERHGWHVRFVPKRTHALQQKPGAGAVIKLFSRFAGCTSTIGPMLYWQLESTQT